MQFNMYLMTDINWLLLKFEFKYDYISYGTMINLNSSRGDLHFFPQL